MAQGQPQKFRAAFGALAALLALGALADAAGPEDFYKGRNISLVIGYSVGGGYDAYARLLARYIGKHIPGSPSIIPEQMTGAGSLRSANFIYFVAPKTPKDVLGRAGKAISSE
jgi:tripartite-type tricarboxylate transporter receptor subunit TctC